MDLDFSRFGVCVSGPISSILVNAYGCRPIMILGGFLCAVGMISASFCNNVMQLYICIGVIGGEPDATYTQTT